MRKMMKKAMSMILALAAMVACGGMFTACETNNPEVEMKIEFDGKVYTLEYKLYRELAPATVRHFLKLAENGYYKDLCVHDYDTNSMLTGAYEYDVNEGNGGLVYKNYYDIVSKYEGFAHTVWLDSEKTNPTYTLKGEFAANSVKIESGALKKSFGALTMEYTAKNVADEIAEVAVLRAEGDKTNFKKYEYNSATSQFSISLSKSETTDSNHCTFATLQENSVAELEALIEAINSYESDFTSEYTFSIDMDDKVIGDMDNTATYNVPEEEIIIRTVKVTKW